MEEDAQKCKCPTGTPAWVMTFADLMSLLMCFFVLLLSFSEMDVLKFKQIAGSMEFAFGVQREIKTREIPKGTSVVAKEFSPGKPVPTPLQVIRQQTTNETKKNLDFTDSTDKNEQGKQKKSEEQLDDIKKKLEKEIQKGQVEVIGQKGQIIIRIREHGSFESGQAKMNLSFSPVMRKISKAIINTPGQVIISGHTDNVPISTRQFNSNWELSSARAVSVLNELIRYEPIENERLSIQGYADTRPIVPNDSPADRAQNRRVEIKIIQGEAVQQETSISKLN